MTQEMVACAIGARSQMARTYLERNLGEFADCDREKLVVHGLRALKESLAQDKDLSVENTSIGIVGIRRKGMKGIESFKLYDGQEVKQWIEMAEGERERAKVRIRRRGRLGRAWMLTHRWWTIAPVMLGCIDQKWSSWLARRSSDRQNILSPLSANTSG